MSNYETKEKIELGSHTSIENAESIASDEGSTVQGHSLQRGLKARHIQMIALGGTIGKLRLFFFFWLLNLKLTCNIS
jgi:lysine-specific permease